MKQVIHVNTWGGVGGAFIACDRLHQALLKRGVDSVLAYGRVLNNSDAQLYPLSSYQRFPKQVSVWEQTLSRGCKRLGLNDIGRICAFGFRNQEFVDHDAILNFHNLHSDYFSYLALAKLTRHQPAVWTLHDMWSFTGHCAYSYDCWGWQKKCGRCPYPQHQPAIRRDATRLEWKLKNWIYSRSQLIIVSPSAWLAEQAKQSMLQRFTIYHIPNGIDTDVYQPLDPHQCRSLLGIRADKNVLMFGAQMLGDWRKGSDLLLTALSELPPALKADTVLLTMGEGGSTISRAVDIESINLGYVSSDHHKSLAYNAADLFIFPTRADNLPLVLQESLACGTPMVSFNIGGVPDLVRPGVTGYLAPPEDAQNLCNGIVRLLEDGDRRAKMRQNCRAIAMAEYSLDLQAQRYIELYAQASQTLDLGAATS